jgi:hypothetical protein
MYKLCTFFGAQQLGFASTLAGNFFTELYAAMIAFDKI